MYLFNIFFTNYDFWQTIAGLVSASSIFFAIFKYLEDKRRNNADNALKQINSFRKEILPIANDILKKIVNERKIDYETLCLKISKLDIDVILDDNPDLSFLLENKKYKEKIELQKDLFKNDIKILQKQTELLNLLEEFALKVLSSKIMKEEVLNSIKHIYIKMVQFSFVSLIDQRYEITGNNAYFSVFKLYSDWINEVDNRDRSERAKDYKKMLLGK